MDARAFAQDPMRLHRLAQTNQAPDRLSFDPCRPFHSAEALARGVQVFFRSQLRTDIVEYCVSAGWVRIATPRSRDRWGRPMLVALRGPTYALLQDRYADPMGWAL